MGASFGSGGQQTPRSLVETTPRISVRDLRKVAAAPATDFAREGLGNVLVSIDGGPAVAIDLEHMPQTLGGVQTFFVCSCGRRCHHLYLYLQDANQDGAEASLVCRRCCGRLDYRVRHTSHPAAIRAAKLRRRLGALPSLLAPVPRKPRHWRPDYYARLVFELAVAEAKIAAMLGATVRAIERRRPKP